VANIIAGLGLFPRTVAKIYEGLGSIGSRIGQTVGIGDAGAADQRLADIAANQRRRGTQPIVVNNSINVRGAIDAQGTARTVSRVLTQQRNISGVRVTAPSGFF